MPRFDVFLGRSSLYIVLFNENQSYTFVMRGDSHDGNLQKVVQVRYVEEILCRSEKLQIYLIYGNSIAYGCRKLCVMTGKKGG
jgi:hypothetical protein